MGSLRGKMVKTIVYAEKVRNPTCWNPLSAARKEGGHDETM